jgi:hypothetical protein
VCPGAAAGERRERQRFVGFVNRPGNSLLVGNWVEAVVAVVAVKSLLYPALIFNLRDCRPQRRQGQFGGFG